MQMHEISHQLNSTQKGPREAEFQILRIIVHLTCERVSTSSPTYERVNCMVYKGKSVKDVNKCCRLAAHTPATILNCHSLTQFGIDFFCALSN